LDLQFRDVAQGRALIARLEELTAEIGRTPISVMHVCGSHEQAIARFGLRATFPEALQVIAGPGCPVCITDMPEIDACIHLAMNGVRVATYGDMLRVPGSRLSLEQARARGARVEVVYSPAEAVRLAEQRPGEEVVLFATGFETTAVATAAVVRSERPPNFSILSAHKYIPPAMEIVAEMPDTRLEGYLAAGHAATITGWGIFEPFVARHRVPVVVAGFEPLDILAGLARLLELIRDGDERVVNTFPRCVTREGNVPAQRMLYEVFHPAGAGWRGIAHVPNGNLRLSPAYAEVDAEVRFAELLSELRATPPSAHAERCICGDVMAGISRPTACSLFGDPCTPAEPVGA